MAAAKSHRELVVWQKSMDLVEHVYRIASTFPQHERFRLTNQLTRAALSVPANIAEGSGRGSLGDYARFISIARGSLMETETLLLLARRLGYVADHQVASTLDLVTEISRMLTRLKQRLRQ